MDSSSVHYQEFFTVHTAMAYGIQVCRQDQDRTPSWSRLKAISKPVWHIPLLSVQWKTPDDGQRNYLKHVEFYSKNKFQKLVHIVGFMIRIYHDAQTPEWLYYVSAGSSEQGCTNPRHQVTKVIKLCTMEVTICASSQWNLLHVTLLVPRILRWLLDFWKICIPLAPTSVKIDFDHVPY